MRLFKQKQVECIFASRAGVACTARQKNMLSSLGPQVTKPEVFIYPFPGKGGRARMPTPQKAEKIDELTEKLGRASLAVLVQTQGLTVKDMNDLRRKMRDAKVEFQVAKNTLLRIATERNNMTAVDKSIFNGPTTVALGYEDEVATAKAIADYVRTSRTVTIKSGILGGR